MTPDYVTMSNVIIDDIVLPNGRSFMNTLGGAGTHALIGMRVWSDRLGLGATVGRDWDPQHRRVLEALGVDLRGVIEVEGYQTARAWQLFEPDERRIEVFRTSREAFDRYQPRLDDLPSDFLAAKGWHLNWGSIEDLVDLVARVKRANPGLRLIWEATPEQLAGRSQDVRSILEGIDVFAPDMAEAQALTGEVEVERMIDKLLRWGVACVALRLGARGSLVATEDGSFLRIPAIPTTIVDVTGAGNAYCGGFLVGLGMGDALADAAARAAVSASFALEQFGVPVMGSRREEEAGRRLRWTRDRIEQAAPGTSAAQLFQRLLPTAR